MKRPATLLRRISFLLLVLALGTGCARFKIEELKPVALFSVPIAASDDENANPRTTIPAERSGRVVYNFPLRPYFNASYVFLVDPPRRLIRVFDTASGTLERIILSARSPVPVPDGVDKVSLALNFPGWVTGDEAGNLYIQNYLSEPGDTDTGLVNPPPEERQPGGLTTLKRPPAPSVILQLDEDNRQTYTLYEDPATRKPFQEILRMETGEDGRLFVLHFFTEDGRKPRRYRMLSEYRGGILVARYGRRDWGNEDERDDYFVDIEDLVSEANGRYVMASVAFRERNTHRPVYRKIYRLQPRVIAGATVDEDEIPPSPAEEVLLTRNPEDFFAYTRDDGGFFLMHPEADGSGVLFKIYDRAGEYINNQLISFPGLRASWRESFLTHDGRIFSTRLYRGKFEIYEWQ